MKLGLQVGIVLALLSGSGTRAAEESDIVLGAVYNQEGVQAVMDVPSSRGARLAVEEINAKGGALGRPVKLLVEDGESDPNVVAAKVTSLLEKYPAMPGLIGLSDTDLVLAAAPEAAKRGRIFLTSGATSPRLPAQVPEWLFLACFGDNVQAAAAAEWAFSKRGMRTVSILYRSDSTYTTLLRRYFRERWQSLGGTVESERGYTPEDVAAGLDGLEKADLIFVSAEGAAEAIEAVKALRGAGFSQSVMGGDGFDAEEEWGKHPALRDVFYTTHVYLGADNQDPQVSAFREAYTKVYPGIEPDGFSALGYDAARLVISAIERARSIEPAAVRTALSETRDFDGVTGRIGYANGSRIPSKSVAIIEVKDGKLGRAAQVLPEVVPPPGN